MAILKSNRSSDPEVLAPEIYTSTWLRSIRFIFFLIILSITSFIIFWNPISNFQSSINQLAQTTLGCPITIETTKLGLFLPRIELHQVQAPSGCFGPNQKDLSFEVIKVYFSGLSLSPLGPVFKLEANYQKALLPVRLTVGFHEVALGIQEELPLAGLGHLIKNMLGVDLSLAGKLDLDFRAVLKNQQMDVMLLKAKGKDVILEKASVYGLNLPNINLQDLSIHAEGKNNKIVLQKFILGKKGKDLFLDSKGSMTLPANGMGQQLIDLKINLTLGEKLLKEFGIIDMVLASYKSSGATGSYQFSLKGDMAAPQISR